MEQNETNKLNIFRFASKKKSITEDSLQQQSSRVPSTTPTISSNRTFRSPSSREDSLTIDTNAVDDSYPPESYFSSPTSFTFSNNSAMETSPTESSLIFERSVEDPTILNLNKCPRCDRSQSVTSMNDPNAKLCNHQSITNLPSHFSMENYISPCLDASTELLTDKNTNLDNVEMVYSRRPSTVLLSSLGRSKSDLASLNGSIPVSRSQSLANIKEPSSPIASNSGDVKPPLLSFYSYADVINSENPNPRRPSITQSLSSSFIRSNSMSNASITPQRTPFQNNGFKFNQSPFGRNPSISRIPPLTGNPGKFQLETSPNSSDSESDYISTKANRAERTPSRRSIQRTHSNVSSHSNFSRNTAVSSPFDPEDGEEDFVVSSIGDRIRRNNGEIRSRHNSIIA